MLERVTMNEEFAVSAADVKTDRALAAGRTPASYSATGETKHRALPIQAAVSDSVTANTSKGDYISLLQFYIEKPRYTFILAKWKVQKGGEGNCARRKRLEQNRISC